MNDLIFLDTETTGLDPEKHEVWEIAWAINDSPIQVEILVHSLKTANSLSLDVNGYLSRYPNGARSDGPMVDLRVRQVLGGNTLVGANPAFDAAFLQKRWGAAPWHYRMIDVESMALAVLGYDRPKGLAGIAEDLTELDYDIALPDHTAAKDVEVLRQVYHALRQERLRLPR